MKPVAGLVLKKDKVKFAGTGAEARAFFGCGGGTFAVKVESPIASGSTVSPEAMVDFKEYKYKAWQMEFGY